MIRKITLLASFILFLAFTNFPSTAQSWNSISNFGGAATDGALALTINGKAYVFGGIKYNEVWEYDPVSDTWSSKASIPVNGNLAWAFGFVLNNQAYVVGGDTTGSFAVTDRVQVYDPVADSWTEKAPYGGGPADGGFAFTMSGKAYVGGGFDGANLKNDFWEYDPVADSWTQLTNLPTGPVIFPVSFTLGNKAYMGTGDLGVGETKAFWEFDPATKNWQQKADLPGGARQAAVGFALDGKGYIGGGQTGYTSNFSDFYEYDPVADSWTAIASFPVMSTAWSSAFVIGNEAYVGLGVIFPAFTFSNAFYKITLGSLSADDEKTNRLIISPNPVTQVLSIENIKLNGPEDELLLLDASGKTIGSYLPPVHYHTKMELDLSALPQGLYFIKANLNTYKLLKL